MGWELDVENSGGIRRGSVRIEPGVNVIRGSNWQGKSSLVAAIEAAMGWGTPLTEDADRGSVVLRTDDRTFAVELEREGETVVRRGEPYLGADRDRVAAGLFAFLDEDNEVRRAVRTGGDLEAVLTRPLDYEHLEERIAERVADREQVEAALDRAADAAAQLPAVEEELVSLEDRLEELEAARADLGPADTDDADRATARDRLSEARAEHKQLSSIIDQLERTIDRTEQRLEERHRELDEVSVPSDVDVEAELAATRERHDDLQREVELLHSVYAANRRVLEEDRLDLFSAVDRDVLGDTVACWICGGEESREAVEDRLSALGERVMEHRRRAEEYDERIEELEAERDAVDRRRRRRADLEDEIAELNTTLTDRDESLASARDRLEEVDARIESISADVEVIDDRRTEINGEMTYVRAKLDDVRDERETLLARAGRRDELEAELDALADEITRLRDRKAAISARLREAFDEAMADILERFDTGFETARLTAGFELVVARNGRPASLGALSEGELELLGIVTALAGYEAFEVGESVPVILLDDLGSLSDENLHTLVAYLEDRAGRLVVTAHPEHGEFGGHAIAPGELDVVSRP